MSSEEEVELKDLVTQTLEANGCLPKIKAQLRSSLYLSLNGENKMNNLQPLMNKKVKNFLNTTDGRIMFCIVQEFLEFCGLDFTLSVYESESCLEKVYAGRHKIIEELGFSMDESSMPVLLKLIRTFKKNAHLVDTRNVISLDLDKKNASIHRNQENDNSFSERPVERNLNATFDVNSPIMVPVSDKSDKKEKPNFPNDSQKSVLDSTFNRNEENTTYEDMSFVAEENSSNSQNNVSNGTEESETNTSQKGSDKSKLSQKSEKAKAKTTFSTLPDLSPLQHKSRVSDILPSLYSKEFKDKSNLRELDKMFDMEAEYEEDFICTGEDLSIKSYLTMDSNKSSESVSEVDKKDSHKSNLEGCLKDDINESTKESG